MRYFLLYADDSDIKWRGKELLRDMLFTSDGADVRARLSYDEGAWNGGQLYCEFLRTGTFSALQHLYTLRLLIAPKDLIEECMVTFNGQIEYVDILEKYTKREFLLIHPILAISSVNFDRSEIERWPANFTLQEWHNPHGRMFIKPVINDKLIPKHLQVFRLKDWPGVSNIVVSESAKMALEKIKALQNEFLFRELDKTQG